MCKIKCTSIRVAKNPYTAILRNVVGKYVRATIPKGNMGYDQYAVPDTVAVERTFVAFRTRKHLSMACRVILSNSFEKQQT